MKQSALPLRVLFRAVRWWRRRRRRRRLRCRRRSISRSVRSRRQGQESEQEQQWQGCCSNSRAAVVAAGAVASVANVGTAG